MSQQLPPIAGGGQDPQLVAGTWRHDWCPKPSELVVIEVKKVFDFCFQEDVLERCFFEPRIGTTGSITGCEITNVTCSEILDREPIPDTDGLALVSIQVNLTLNITVVPMTGAEPVVVTRQIAFPKRVVLCAPLGTDIVCEVRGTCICTVQPQVVNGGTTTDPNVCCTIQLCVVNIVDGCGAAKLTAIRWIRGASVCAGAGRLVQASGSHHVLGNTGGRWLLVG